MTQTTSPQPCSVAVIGGGITGLTAAYKLASAGKRVRLFEQSSRLGGSIRTERSDGWLVECGPNSLLEGEIAVRELIAELGLENDLVVGAALAKNRFIVRDGKVQPLPNGPGSFFKTKLFSTGMKFRIFAEMFQRPRQRPNDVSLQQFVFDHFGQEAVDYGLNPFVSGVYAGDPQKLSAKHSFAKLWEAEQSTGSILRGMRKLAKARKATGAPKSRIVSFKEGLQTLPNTLAAKLPQGAVQLNACVVSLERQNGQWQLVWSGAEGQRSESFDAVVCAVPPDRLAGIRLAGAPASSFAVLAEIIQPPVTSLFLGYRREQVKHPLDGFGALIPAVEKRRELGILFSSSLFEGRAPAGHVALTVMVGGLRQPEIARLSEAELLETVRPDLRELLGVEGDPVFKRYTAWPAAIPQYNLGYEKYFAAIEACEKANLGLYIGGNCRDGISVPNCLCSGLRLAGQV